MSILPITQELLRSLLDYDQESGLFYWKKTVRSDGRVYKYLSGTIAGCFSRTTRSMVISINNRKYLAHRLAWLWMTGEWPQKEVDHIDVNRLNNKWANLRHATRTQNQCNTKKVKSNTSGYKGVSFDKNREVWRATITLNRKQTYLGSFQTPESAYEAYVAASKRLHGDFGRV